MSKTIVCKSCNEYVAHYAHGMCKSCYMKIWLKDHAEQVRNCENQWKYMTGRAVPMSENKSCAAFLGIYIAETVLSKIFKNVEMMSRNNRGFDFICGKGLKIDVKSSCIHAQGNRSNSWQFTVSKNKVADRFLCLAFDNREDLNPLHIWLIPGEDVNDKMGIVISESRINKWDDYKLDINKVIKCCDVMRGK